MTSKVTLTFNSIPLADTEIDISASFVAVLLRETFKANRTASGQTVIGGTTASTASQYAFAFGVDYNNNNLYTITVAGNIVTIQANNPETNFLATDTTNGAVTVTVTNVAYTAFTIDSIVASEASSDQCNKVKITATSSEQADSVSGQISQAVGTNPFIFETTRDGKMSITMAKGSLTDRKSFFVPKLLSTFFTLDKVNTPGGTTLNISNSYITSTFKSNIEYSINNTDWKSTPKFTALIADDYTLYIRDNLGCSITMDFTVEAFTGQTVPVDPVCEISNINPIRYKLVDSGVKNILNTLSFEENVRNVYNSFTQSFQKSDTPTTQIKTTYETVEAVVIDTDGNETSLTASKVTENLNRTDVRDATIVEIPLVFGSATYNGYMGINYQNGNTYDSTTLAINGSYNLGGTVPTWIEIGSYVSVDGVGYVKVIDIIEVASPAIQGSIVVLNAIFSNYPLTHLSTYKVYSYYNAVDYERWEVYKSFAALDGYYKVQITCSDSLQPTKVYLSEWLNVRESFNSHYDISYYNSENNEINYFTGVRFNIRIPYLVEMRWSPDNNQENYVTDTNTVTIEERVREFYEFVSSPLPTVVAQKLVLILSQDRLFIDGINYLKEGAATSKPVGGNRYQVVATLVRSNYVYDSNGGSDSNEIVLPTGQPLAINQDSSGLLLL